MAAAAILNFVKSGIFGYRNPCMANIYQYSKLDENIFVYDRDMAKNRKLVWPIYQCTKFDQYIFIYDRDMAINRTFKMAAAVILNFAKSGIFGHSNHCMANIYQCAKFDENIFIYDRGMAKNRKFKMAAAAMLFFKRCNFGPQ